MSTIEFYRPESQRPVDADGYELPPWENPFFAIPPDDDQVEPSEPGPDFKPLVELWADNEVNDALFVAELADWFDTAPEPSADDEAWLASQSSDAVPYLKLFSPAEDDPAGYDEWSRHLEEMHQASQWQDRLEQMNYVDGDANAEACGLPVG